jgi:hypothetical protein
MSFAPYRQQTTIGAHRWAPIALSLYPNGRQLS